MASRQFPGFPGLRSRTAQRTSDDGAPWRIRVMRAVLPATVLVFGAWVLLPGRASVPDAPVVAGSTMSECVPVGSLRSVEDLNRIATQVRGGPHFRGGDLGASVRLQDGRQLFVFGNTLRLAEDNQPIWVRNSMLVFSPGCGSVVLTPAEGPVIPDRADGVGYLPMSIAVVPGKGYDLVAVTAQRVDPAVSLFDVLGPAAAFFVVPRGGTPQLIDQADFGPDRAGTDNPMWGAAISVVDQWVYLYGTSRPAGALSGYALKLARVPAEELLDRSAWHYWDGATWSPQVAAAADLIAAEGGVSQALGVFEQGGEWYAVSRRNDVVGTELTVWTAPEPQGPFDGGTSLARLTPDVGGLMRYTPLAHPDLFPEAGTVVVSWSQNHTDPAVVEQDPLLFRPRFLRIALPH